MSFDSNSTPGSSPSKSIPISISPRNMASPTSSLYSNYSSASISSRGSSCAYPSWASMEQRTTPSSYISDAELFGDAFDDDSSCPWLEEAPAPPRVPPMAQAFPILPPLYAPKKKTSERRRSSGRKQRRSSKPMTPISESPEQVE